MLVIGAERRRDAGPYYVVEARDRQDVCGWLASAIHGDPGVRRLRYAALELDPVKRRAWRDGRELELSATEYALLKAFLARPEEALSRSGAVPAGVGLRPRGDLQRPRRLRRLPSPQDGSGRRSAAVAHRARLRLRTARRHPCVEPRRAYPSTQAGTPAERTCRRLPPALRRRLRRPARASARPAPSAPGRRRRRRYGRRHPAAIRPAPGAHRRPTLGRSVPS